MPDKVLITLEGDDIIRIQCHPDFMPGLVGLAIATLGCIAAFATRTSVAGWLLLLLVIMSIYSLFQQRELLCVINKRTGLVSYQRGGIFDSHLGRQETEFLASAITAVQMKRYTMRYKDLFQIRLAVSPRQQLALSGTNLSFSECQRYAQEMQRLIGTDLRVVAID